MKQYNIGIVGATGAVGLEMIQCLYTLKIPFASLILGWSTRSAWKNLETPFWSLTVQEVNDDFFHWIDIALFAAWWDISKKYVQKAVDSWALVIDNSSAFRYNDDVPLVIPQINKHAIWKSRIIANPNCTTAIAAVVLHPIFEKYGLKKILMSTYQATSGAWAKWMEELLSNTKSYLEGSSPTVENFSYNIAFNLIPQIDAFQDNAYTKEEMKVAWETHKIFEDNSIDISCTAVRIPTLRAHSESIIVETKEKVNIQEVKDLLATTPWVDLKDDIKNNIYPMPSSATWKYNVEVWRIRQSLVFWEYGIELFISWDQLLRWAALNAVEILETYIHNH